MQIALRNPALVTLVTLIIGLLGAAIGWAASMPAAFLIGPALLVSIASGAGVKTDVAVPVRTAAMVVLGVGVGAGFDAAAGAAILRWPLAFVALVPMLAMMILSGQWVLRTLFGFDRQSAILAVVPGHLSLVIALAMESGLDVKRVILVQTIRLMSLIVLVPYAALAVGYRLEATVLPSGAPMAWAHLFGLTIGGILLAILLRRLNIPAPWLLGPMILSGAGHLTGLTPGTAPDWLLSLAFICMGGLLGSRFSGLTRAMITSGLAAGLVATLTAVAVTTMFALPVAMVLGMSGEHVMTAFAPGGLETMIALGVAMGASPGFVAGCHVMRLVILSGMLPLFLKRGMDRDCSSSR